MLEWATVFGDSDSPAVVLLHPAGATRHIWRPHVEQLRDDYRVVTLDLPAHGIHPIGEFDFERAVADVGEILDMEGSAVLVGHSQGGYVALRAAAEYGKRVDGLLLAGAAYNWRTPKMMAFSMLYYPVSYLLEAVCHSERLRKWTTDRFGADMDEAQKPPEDEDWYGPLHGNAQAIRSVIFQKSWPHVEAFEGPVMIAHGEGEILGGHAEELAERVDADLRWYDGGHQTPTDDPEAFIPFVDEFLNRVYGTQ